MTIREMSYESFRTHLQQVSTAFRDARDRGASVADNDCVSVELDESRLKMKEVRRLRGHTALSLRLSSMCRADRRLG